MQTAPTRLPTRRLHSGPNRGKPPLALRDWPVRAKLGAVLAVPAIALMVVAGLNIAASLDDARTLRRAGTLAKVGHQRAALVHALQAERDLTVGAIADPRDRDPQALSVQRAIVDRAAAAHQRAVAAVDTAASPQLATASGLPGRLGALRHAANSGALTRQAVADDYSQLIAALLDIDLATTPQGGDALLAQQARAVATLARAKELSSQVRGLLYAIATTGRLARGDAADLADLLAQQQATLDQYRQAATAPQAALLADTLQGQAVLTVQRIEQTAISRQDAATLGVNPQQWLAASTTRLEQLNTVQARLLDDLITRTQTLSAAAQRRWITNATLILAVLALAVLASLAIARSMVQPLRQLRRAALEVAHQRLPNVVERLHTVQDLNQVAAEQARPLAIRSNDEIGQVGTAFNAVHEVAVKVAAEQAALRKSIGDMFLNLARRSQRLIDRALEHMDGMQADEDDPDRLQRLFDLDHLITRLRRAAEGLIVLSGAEPPRRWSDPQPLPEVIRAAQQEVEDLHRIELLPIDEIGVVGHAVADITHLLAELLENATSFSPPGTVVRVAGQPAATGYVVEIEDRGLGMSDDELLEANERLANPPLIDVAVSRMLGLVVVGRLSQRYGIRVQLRHSWYGGVTALVLVPSALLTWSAAPPEPTSTPHHAQLTLPPADPPPPSGIDPPSFDPDATAWFDADHPTIHRTARPTNPTTATPLDLPRQHPAPTSTGTPTTVQATQPAGPTLPATSDPSAVPPGPPTYADPGPPDAPHPPHLTTSAAPLTPGGLPRRQPRANLAPGISSQRPAPAQPQPARSPEEIRAMLSSYRSGLERGRRMAASSPPRPDQPNPSQSGPLPRPRGNQEQQ